MGLVIELYRRKNSGVLRADYEIVAQPIDAVVPGVEVLSLLHSKYAGDLDLGQDDVIRQGANEPEVQDLLRLGQ